jgi:hypothetical protein
VNDSDEDGDDDQQAQEFKGKTLSGFPFLCHCAHRPGPGKAR